MVLTGFTIQNGHMDGGGIACYESNPKISHNVIQNNLGSFHGGGIFLVQASPIIESNVIASNSVEYVGSGDGGGILCWDNSHPRISGNMIRENTAAQGGGIGCVISSEPTIYGNTIVDNGADSGGGIYCSASSPVIENNIIEGNTASGFGGGIFLTQSDPIIHGNIVKDNVGWANGGGIYAVSNSVIDLSHNGLYGNSTIMYGGAIYCEDCDLSVIGNTLHDNSASWGSGMALFSSSINVLNTIFSGQQDGVAVGISAPVTMEVSYCDFYGNSGGNIDGSIPEEFGVLTTTNANGDACDVYMNIFLDPLYCDPDNSDYTLAATSPAIGAGDGGSDIGAFGIGCGLVDVIDDESCLPDRLALSNHSVVWNGKDAMGRAVPSGTYVVRLEADSGAQASKVMLIR
jgi:parallel beta-helix repeat protein